MRHEKVLEHARALQPQIVEWRRDIHAHPETSFEEVRTANLVAAELRRLGLEVETGIAKTGVVARLGEGGPVIGIRADMDALPVTELNDVPYASQTPGKMHACGHDAHTAILMGVANILTAMPDRPAGEIRFLFQPSEEKQDNENKSGGMRMVEEGAMEGIDAVIALHVSSKIESGKIEIGSGYVMAAVDEFRATIKGKGCHGAAHHQGIDPIFLLGQVINAIYGVRARRIDPTQPAVISICSVHSGTASNVVPDEATLIGTLRSYSPEIRQQLRDEVEQAISIVRALGGDYEYSVIEGYPATYNDTEVAALIGQTAADLFGAEDVLIGDPMMGAEDFSYMAQQAPGAMLFLGTRIGEDNRPHHSPIFNIEEEALYRGAAILAETAVRLLDQHKQ